MSELPAAIASWTRRRFRGPFFPRPASGAAHGALADGAAAPQETWLIRTPARTQGSSELCCVFAAAAAMETRIGEREGAPHVEIDIDELWKQSGSRDPYAATRAAEKGAPDDRGRWRRATCEELYGGTPNGETLRKRMVDAIANGQPLTIQIVVWPDFDDFGGDGLYNPPGNGAAAGDHAVCVVGHGVTEDNVRYWIARNSYGSDWGDEGFVRIPWAQKHVKPERCVFVYREVS